MVQRIGSSPSRVNRMPLSYVDPFSPADRSGYSSFSPIMIGTDREYRRRRIRVSSSNRDRAGVIPDRPQRSTYVSTEGEIRSGSACPKRHQRTQSRMGGVSFQCSRTRTGHFGRFTFAGN